MSNELKFKSTQLHWLQQITKAVNYNLPASKLFEIYEQVVTRHFGIGKLLLFMNENGWRQMLSHGVTYQDYPIDIEKDFTNPDNFLPGNKPDAHWAAHFEIIIPVTMNDRYLAYAFLSDFSKILGDKNETISFIHTITHIIITGLENKRLTQESIARAAMQKELELAAEMQLMLFPSGLEKLNDYEIAATYLPNGEVGGDFYDFIILNEEESLVCMADVSGKGIAAALLASSFQAHLRALAPSHLPLTDLVHHLNKTVFDNARGERFITAFIALLNRKNRAIRYINAGHNPAILQSGSNQSELKSGTTGLGMLNELPFVEESETSFEKDTVLFAYTDGVTECENSNGEFFGTGRLFYLLQQQSPSTSASFINQQIISQLKSFSEGIHFQDDITILSLRMK